MAPDERNIGGLIRKALGIKAEFEWKISTPGIYVARKNLKDLLIEISKKYDEIVYLREDGVDIRSVVCNLKNPLFILGDHLGLKEDDEKLVMKYAHLVLSLSPISLQADQCITITHYELDRCKS